MLDAQLVELLVEAAELGHADAIEGAEQQHPVLELDVQARGGVAQALAQAVRAHRQFVGFQRRRAREHAEALAQREQRLAVADLGLAGDFLQRQRFLEFLGLDQRQVLALAARHAREARHVVAAVERGEGCFQPDDEARRDVGAAAADLAQGFEAAVLVLVRLGLFGQLEQLLLELVERRGDALLQRHAGDRKHRLEHRARTRRQRRLLEVRQRLVLR